jgi:hypothetical protein
MLMEIMDEGIETGMVFSSYHSLLPLLEDQEGMLAARRKKCSSSNTGLTRA